MTSNELRTRTEHIETLSNEIFDRAVETAAHGHINHLEIIKALVTRIVEQDERADELERRLDEIRLDVRRLEGDRY